MSSLIDLQVNGYAGVDFSSPALNQDGIDKVSRRLFKEGTGAYLPTVVTAARETYEAVLPLLAKAASDYTKNTAAASDKARVLGIHMEGPFISPEEGARGAHQTKFIQAADTRYFRHLLDLCDGQLKILTLAPEIENAAALIGMARDAGVVVSSGHSMTGYAAASAAVKAGLSLITHTGNGCPSLLNRHENPVYAQLVSGARPMLIPDGHHLPAPFIAMVAALAGRDQVIAVSDVSPVGGLPPGDYETFGTAVTLRADGKLVCRDSEYLAGSASLLKDCLNWLARQGWTEAELWRIGRDNPLHVMGMTTADIPDAGLCWDGKAYT